MKEKLLFIVFHGIDKLGGGIGKKILSQVEAFKSVGAEVSLSALEVDENNVYSGRSVNGEIVEHFMPVFGKNVSWMWRISFRKLYTYILDNQFTQVYIRYSHFANPFFNWFLKRLKQKGIIILLEIPTFPYDDEYVGAKLSLKIIKYVEGFYRNYFHKYVSRIVTFSNEDEIFKIKTIKIHNGIDLNIVPQKQETNNEKEIHIIAVAVMNIWHGYDRLIEGVNEYYKEKTEIKVYVHIVGDGQDKESDRYRQLVDTFKLQDYVLFHGFQSGEDLDNLFDLADIGVGPLGFHRVGVNYVTPIKLAEYAARGLPFIYSGNNDLFDIQTFVFKETPDEIPVDIQEIVDFYDEKRFKPEEIRKFAKEHLIWETQMNKIMDELTKLAEC